MQISAKCVVLYIDLQFCIQNKKSITRQKNWKHNIWSAFHHLTTDIVQCGQRPLGHI